MMGHEGSASVRMSRRESLMGTTIFKVDDDLYVVWGSVTESPTLWGTRADLIEFMIAEEVKWATERAQRDIPPRFDKADQYGSSAGIPRGYQLPGDDTEIFQQKGTLRISDLGAFVASYDVEKGTYDESWIKPFDDPDFKDHRVGRREQKGPWTIPHKPECLSLLEDFDYRDCDCR
jgi:hypothetical protein